MNFTVLPYFLLSWTRTHFSSLGGSLFWPVTPAFCLVCDPPTSAKLSLHVYAPHKIDPPDRTHQNISDLNMQYQTCEIVNYNVKRFNLIND